MKNREPEQSGSLHLGGCDCLNILTIGYKECILELFGSAFVAVGLIIFI
jgi:hypothetical protein